MNALELLDQPATSTLRNRVRDWLAESDEADPRRAVAGFIDSLEPDDLRQAAQAGLVQMAREIVLKNRSDAFAYKGDAPPPDNGSAKWANARAAQRERPDLLGVQICVDMTPGAARWKFLGECSKSDLAGAEQIERGRGETLIAQADRFRRLGRKLKRDQVVRDLGRSTVERIFDA